MADSYNRKTRSSSHSQYSHTAQKKVSVFSGWNTVANWVTIIRIALVLIFIILLVLAGPAGVNNLPMRWVSVVIFVIAGCTDKLDGYLARSRNEVTELGKWLDPIADKLLVCSALVILSLFGEIFWWLTALFLFREIGITILRFSVRKKDIVVPSSTIGKAKTVCEIIAITMYLIPMWSLNPEAGMTPRYYSLVSFIVILFALELSWWSGYEYMSTVLYEMRNPGIRDEYDDFYGNDADSIGWYESEDSDDGDMNDFSDYYDDGMKIPDAKNKAEELTDLEIDSYNKQINSDSDEGSNNSEANHYTDDDYKKFFKSLSYQNNL